MDVGVRELKQHLSEFLRRVAAGETLQVTDRGRPVAVLMPVVGADPLAQAVDEGWVRPPVHTGRVGGGPRARASGRVLDALAEDRGE